MKIRMPTLFSGGASLRRYTAAIAYTSNMAAVAIVHRMTSLSPHVCLRHVGMYNDWGILRTVCTFCQYSCARNCRRLG